MQEKERLLNELARCVRDMEDEEVAGVAQAYLAAGFDAYDGIQNGLAVGMTQAGALHEKGEYYIPELLLCADAMYNGVEVLEPQISVQKGAASVPVVIGVVEGDTHDIGKNLVKLMLEANGFQVYDLGRDVSAAAFVEKVRETHAKILCLSTLMTTTMDCMGEIIRELERAGLRDSVKVMVGGGPLSESFAQSIGADAYTANAAEAARRAKELAGS